MTLASIREQRTAKVAEARTLLSTAERESRQLTADESSRFDSIKSEITALESAESRQQFVDDQERRSAGTVITGDTAASIEKRVSLIEAIASQVEGRAATGAVAEYSAEVERRTGKRGVFVPLSAFEKRQQTTTTASGIVSDDYRPDQFVGALRDALIFNRLGARTLTGLRGDVVIPRHASSMSAQWIAEGESLTETGMTFDQIRLAPRHVGILTELSRQILQQSDPSIEELVRADMRAVLAHEFDRALLLGDGTREPLGLLNQAGIQNAELPTDWAGVLGILEQLESANVTPNAWLASPATATALRGALKSASAGADYLMQSGRLADLPVVVSNTVPADTLIAGNFNEVVIGVWDSVQILANPFAEGPYKRGGVMVRALMTADMAIRRPEAFVVAEAP